MKVLNNILLNGKLLAVMTIILASSLLASCAPSGNGKTDEPVTLRLAHFFPDTHPVEKLLVQKWIEEVEKATEGMVSIDSYPNNTLSNANEMYKNVIDGVADIGISCFSYTSGRFPVMEVFELPGIIYANAKSASMVAWEGVKKLDPDEVKDTKLMMVLATGSGDLFTKDPVDSLEDLKGMTIRATGLSAETIKALGGTPDAMSQAEAYDALSKGLVKGNIGPIEILKGWNQAEVTKYITKTPFLYNTLFYMTMNLDKWNSLSSDIQETILGINEKLHEEVASGLWDIQNEAALDFAVNEKGMQLLNLTEEETARWIEKVETVQQQKINACELLDNETLEMVKQLADKYNELYK